MCEIAPFRIRQIAYEFLFWRCTATVALPCTNFEIFNVEVYRDFDIHVKRQSSYVFMFGLYIAEIYRPGPAFWPLTVCTTQLTFLETANLTRQFAVIGPSEALKWDWSCVLASYDAERDMLAIAKLSHPCAVLLTISRRYVGVYVGAH